jgi:hypothetical protein
VDASSPGDRVSAHWESGSVLGASPAPPRRRCVAFHQARRILALPRRRLRIRRGQLMPLGLARRSSTWAWADARAARRACGLAVRPSWRLVDPKLSARSSSASPPDGILDTTSTADAGKRRGFRAAPRRPHRPRREFIRAGRHVHRLTVPASSRRGSGRRGDSRHREDAQRPQASLVIRCCSRARLPPRRPSEHRGGRACHAVTEPSAPTAGGDLLDAGRASASVTFQAPFLYLPPVNRRRRAAVRA